MLSSFKEIRRGQGFQGSCLPAGRGSNIDFPKFHFAARTLDPLNPIALNCAGIWDFFKGSIHDLNSLINISLLNR
jgi:hypothetical protein